MAAGGFRTFIPGEVLLDDLINDFLMQGVLVFADAAARDAAITAPVEGQFCFLKDSDTVEFYDGSDWVGLSGGVFATYYVVGGGGAGRVNLGGGGGGGGYLSGLLNLSAGPFSLQVGAGGATDSDGTDSFIGSLVADGGGAGGGFQTAGNAGGCGGGAGANRLASTTVNGGAATTGQGNRGGNTFRTSVNTGSAGGGGVGVQGTDNTNRAGGSDGGEGAVIWIGSTAFPCGGGGGGAGDAVNDPGLGMSGGGDGSPLIATAGGAGATNSGSGGGGGRESGTAGGLGGSGVIVLVYPDTETLTIDVGLTESTTTASGFKTTRFTAGSGSVSL